MMFLYMSMHEACMYECIRAYVCKKQNNCVCIIYSGMCMHTFLHICVWTFMHVRTYVRMHACLQLCLRMYVCIHACVIKANASFVRSEHHIVYACFHQSTGGGYTYDTRKRIHEGLSTCSHGVHTYKRIMCNTGMKKISCFQLLNF
jgi:hypothetical protein